MNEAERDAAMTGMLYRVSVISGCPMPSDETELQVLENELVSVFTENPAYSSLNSEEVALAFRMNATGESAPNGEKVKHWKDLFNLEYLAEVLRRYLDIRGSLERKIEAEELKQRVLPAAPRTPEQDDRETEGLINIHYAGFLAGTLKPDFILPCEYDLLSAFGMLNLDIEGKEMLMQIGKARRLAYLQDSARVKSDFKYAADAALDFEKDLFSQQEHDAIVREAKRIAVWNYFTDLKGGPLTFIKNPFRNE